MLKNWMLAVSALVAIVVVLALLAWYGVMAPSGSHTTAPTSLYDIVGSNGSVYNFGATGSYGSLAGKAPDKPIAAIAVTPAGRGYWIAGSDGAVYPFGDASTYGSMGSKPLNKPIVGMAATPDGKGYWLVASDGGIFAFGDASFHGSTGGRPLNEPIVGMATTPDGKGYWLVASDGGIFAFGDASFHGSMGGTPLGKPVVGMAATPDGKGYWLVASDGGVFAFGDAAFHGSMGGKPLNMPMVGIAATPSGNGYWLVAADGGIFSFNAPFYGSMGGKPIGTSVVGIASAQAPAPPHGTPPPSTLAPGIGSFVASSTLPATGGTSALQWSTTNANSCTVSASPAISGLKYTAPCSDDGISVVVPLDATKRPITYTFTLEASGASGEAATATAQTTVQAAAPSIDSFHSPITVPWRGGTANLQWSTADATSCTVTASPDISGLPATVPCSKGSQSVTFHANTGTKNVDYTFKLDAEGASAPDATATTQTMLQAPPKMLITVSSNPLVETGPGDIQAVVQVSTTDRLAGALVNISSVELDALCRGGVTFTTIAPGVTAAATSNPIQVTLDGDGNAAVMVNGDECAAGSSLIEADLAATPFYTALTTLNVVPPHNTTRGLADYPNDEIVTGDTTPSGESDVYAVFYVSTSSTYAEQYVEIQANELVDRCGEGSYWVSNQGASTTTGTVSGSSSTWRAQLDDNGNAVFGFFGASCASGASTVLASIEAGLHHGYSTLFKILSPRTVIP